MIFADIINFFSPKVCSICQNILYNTENIICNICELSLSICENSNSKLINDLKSLENVKSVNYYLDFDKKGFTQRIIHSIKYKNNKSLALILGSKLNEKHIDIIESADYIIPVPLHKIKLKARGYNQAEYIARGINNTKTNINILKRIKYTQTQTKLNKTERISNVFSAFELCDEIKNKNVIIIDDVLTTGATIIECAKLFKNNNVHLMFLAIARN